MRAVRLGVSILLLAGLAPRGAAADHLGAQPAPRNHPCGVRVESYTEHNGAAFNLEIERALAAQERWPHEPMQLVLRRLGVGEEMARGVCIDVQGRRGEVQDSLVATAVMEGLADDSVAGVWARMELRRQPDGTWRLAREARAWKCARGAHMDRYQDRPCR
jgi:hypothetical protein